MKMENPIKAFKPLDLSPVTITPTKQKKIIRNPSSFNIFFDFKKFNTNPTTIKEKPHKNAQGLVLF